MTTTAARPAASDSSFPTRVTSIDALRGLVMFTMIFVNDLAGVSHQVVPWWMRHFKADGNGMTFVDLVFPAFLFIVGMSILIWVLVRVLKGHFSPSYYVPVELGGLYWHLVDLVWIFLFPLIYLI